MLQVNRLREFLTEVKNTIDAINYTQVIVTDSDFVKFLKERKSGDNIILFAVLPDHGLNGKEDATKYGNFLQFNLIEKSTTNNLKHDDILDLYNRVQLAVKAFIDLILENKSNGDSDFCNLFEHFNEDSVDIKVFWDGFESRGYEVYFSLLT
jgi:predicted AlkP superfamily pyrophosphatase or phosphodiesterase